MDIGPGGKELSNMFLRSPKQSPVEYARIRDCSQWQGGQGSWWEGWHWGPGSQGVTFRRSLGEKRQQDKKIADMQDTGEIVQRLC